MHPTLYLQALLALLWCTVVETGSAFSRTNYYSPFSPIQIWILKSVVLRGLISKVRYSVDPSMYTARGCMKSKKTFTNTYRNIFNSLQGGVVIYYMYYYMIHFFRHIGMALRQGDIKAVICFHPLTASNFFLSGRESMQQFSACTA